MFKVVTEYSISEKKGGYRLQWVGANKPSYIVGDKGTCGWYKFKNDAVKAAESRNKQNT